MKNTGKTYATRDKSIALLLFVCLSSAVQGQVFQNTIGFPGNVSERSPGGLVLPGGAGYLLPADNFNHPGNPPDNTDANWEIVRLDANGDPVAPSKWIGTPATESVAWMEPASHLGTPGYYIVAGSEDGDMTLTLLAGNGTPVWSRKAGTSAHTERSACVKVDGDGNYVLVGTQTNAVSGQELVVVVKVDDNGTVVWKWAFSIPGYDATVASVTTFTTFSGSCLDPNINRYYITGRIRPISGGDEQVFLMSCMASSGLINFLNQYDIDPGYGDAGTWIESDCISATTPEIWISGYSNPVGFAGKTFLLLKTDTDGEPLWANNYDLNGGGEFVTHFTLESDGTVLVTGKATETAGTPGASAGNCFLSRIEADGSTVNWSKLYLYPGRYTSRGNRVERAPDGRYFVSGAVQPSAALPAFDILALLTEPDGSTTEGCYTDLDVKTIARQALKTTFNPAQISPAPLEDLPAPVLNTHDYTDGQKNCYNDCYVTFTYTCYTGHFTAHRPGAPAGAYTYEWDVYCDGNIESTTTSPDFSYTFPAEAARSIFV